MSQTASGTYFEDFAPGPWFRHARGRTVGELENVLITTMVLNTADSHFNQHRLGRHVVFGGVTASIVIGLTMQDTGENAVAEVGLTGMRFLSPVFHGDTLYAATKVLEVNDVGRHDAGEVTFSHAGFNQDGVLVLEGQRRVLVRKRSAPE